MQLLSLTFHAEQNKVEDFKTYLQEVFLPAMKSSEKEEDFILSEVEHGMITEGKNFNVVVFFKDEEARSEFLHQRLPKVGDEILKNFGSWVMIFDTELKPIAWKISK